MTYYYSLKLYRFLGPTLLLLASSFMGHAKSVQFTNPPSATVCKDNVWLTLSYTGVSFVSKHSYQAQLFTNGDFNVNEKDSETSDGAEFTMNGKFFKEQHDRLIQQIDKTISSIAPYSGKQEINVWYLSYCKDGITKTILGRAPHRKDPDPAEKLILELRQYLQKELGGRREIALPYSLPSRPFNFR